MLELKEYNVRGILDDETSVLEDFISNYIDNSAYICDAITEQADSAIPIYYADIWKNAKDISEYIEDAISEGLAPVDGNDIDLQRIFQAGYYNFYTSLLYDNLDIIAYNTVVSKVNEHIEKLTEEQLEKIDMDDIEERIERETEDYDINNYMSDLSDFADEIIGEIDEMIEEGTEV